MPARSESYSRSSRSTFVEAREYVTRNRFVAPCCGPHAARSVASAHVHRSRDAGQPLEDHAVELGVGDELVRHVVPVLLEGRAVGRIDVPLRVVGRVDLDVVAAELDQPIDDVFTQDASDVLDELVRRRIRALRVLRMPVDPVPARRGDRVLRADARVRLEERVLVLDDVAVDLEATRHEWLLRRQAGRIRGLARARLPEVAPARLGVEELEARDGRPEERIVDDGDQRDPAVAPVLAVRDRLDSGALLQSNRLEDGPVLEYA